MKTTRKKPVISTRTLRNPAVISSFVNLFATVVKIIFDIVRK